MKSKSITLIALIAGIISLCFIPGNDFPVSEKETKAGIEWDATTHDFGKIIQNKPAKAEFEFKNTSMVPLVIKSVKPSCGCTVADYPSEPIQPGNTAKIAVSYNAKSPGYFAKSITVNSNASAGKTILYIKGEVIKH